VLTVDRMRSLVRQATLSPSSHNTQPWRFRMTGAAVDLMADRTRALPVNDPFDRELTISCGAALLSLRVAAAAAGLGTVEHLLPDESDADWLARLELTAQASDPELAALADFLSLRRTFRRVFDGRDVAQEVIALVGAAAAREGARLVTLNAGQRQQAGELVAEGDRQQWDDPRWRRELAMWMHPRRDGDGLAVPLLAAPLAQAVVRTFDMGNGVAAKDRQLLMGSPWLTILATPQDDTLSWLRAGQALQRALLVGCRHGLQASYLNQPAELPALRARLQLLLGTAEHPQLVIRWGHPTEVLPPAPRRPVDAVIEPASD